MPGRKRVMVKIEGQKNNKPALTKKSDRGPARPQPQTKKNNKRLKTKSQEILEIVSKLKGMSLLIDLQFSSDVETKVANEPD